MKKIMGISKNYFFKNRTQIKRIKTDFHRLAFEVIRDALIFVFLIIGITSCDLLTTRNPEKPDALASNNIPAMSPDILFSNLKSALQEKVVENYMQCFADPSFLQKEFRFIPSTTQYPILNNWNLDLEKQNFVNLKSRSKTGNSIVFELSNTTTTQFGDSAIYQYDYILSLSANDQNINGVYKGRGEFKIFLDKRNPPQWVIVEWRDFAIGNSLSWSELKGRLY